MLHGQRPKPSASWLSDNVPPREIVQFPIFTQDFEMYRQNYPEMDDIYHAIVLSLLDNPFEGKPLETFPDFRTHLTKLIGSAPAFNVMYSYDTEHIYLYAITTVKF